MDEQTPKGMKSKPGYADGFEAAFGNRIFDTDRGDDVAYCYGYEAGERARKLFLENGFSSTRDGGFAISLAAVSGA